MMQDAQKAGLLTRQPPVRPGASCLKQGYGELRSEAARLEVRRESERRATALARSFSTLSENMAKDARGMAGRH